MHVANHHFKMDILVTALALVTPVCWFLSLDFTDTYYSVSIAFEHRKQLRFQFDGTLFEYTAIPNGLGSGLRLFTKILKVPVAHLQEVEEVTITIIWIRHCYLQIPMQKP